MRVAYDESTLYVGARLYTDAREHLVTDELKRDFDERNGDLFGIVLDTFLDHRNSYGFLTNPGGAQREVQAFANGQKNDASWDGVWFVHTSRQDDGWTVEAAIPFKALRFPDRAVQEWGLNFVRVDRRENEVSMWSAVPRPQTAYHVGYAGRLTGIEGVRPGHNLRATPFVAANTARPDRGTPWRSDADGGLDIKWAVTPSFVLDGTFRTDVEALWMQGASAGPEDDNARRLRARLRGNRRRATFDYLHVGDRFRHDLGFVRRRGTAMIYGDYAEVFRPAATKRWAREHTLRVEAQTHLNTRYDAVLTNQDRLVYGVGFPHGGEFRVTAEHNFERALESYKLRGVLVPAGSYQFNELVLMYTSDRSAHLSGQVQTNYGDFWGGTRRRLKSSVRLRMNTHLAASLAYEREQIALPNGAFVADLASLRVDWSLSTRMFVNTLVQDDGGTWLSNVRFNFLHRPLSNIYVVWNEGRGTPGASRALILKCTHSVGF